MSRFHKTAIYIWLIILTIISILALCRSFYNDITLGIDYSGILVSILAALCTVLIGWQIYTLVDLKNINDKFVNIETKRNDDNLRIVLQIYESISMLTYQLANGARKEELLPQAIMFDLLSIVVCSQMGRYDVCNNNILNIIQTIPKGTIVRSQDKKFYISTVRKIHGVENISSYHDLLTWVVSLRESQDQ